MENGTGTHGKQMKGKENEGKENDNGEVNYESVPVTILGPDLN